MKLILLIAVFTCSCLHGLFSQMSLAVPDASQPIIIPVVVHVVYNSDEQNISNEQVRSQINALNRDYRKKNDDARYIPAAFRSYAADTRIEFRLATSDPSGLPTNGIVRKGTASRSFTTDDKVKSSLTGGDDPWNRDQYLNIWVCNLIGAAMGYASTPACAAEKDGVVIRYTAFGTTPNVQSPYNMGRTTVHEVGHWLGLRHIWGDSPCGDDNIADTPPQQGPTRGCPSGVVATCSSGAAGNMYMNYMDFTNDACTNMFTLGQVNKMHELFMKGGAREPLLSSHKADGASADDVALLPEGVSIYPNPAVDVLNVRLPNTVSLLKIYNHLGQVCKTVVAAKSSINVDISELKAGMYFVADGSGRSWKFIKCK